MLKIVGVQRKTGEFQGIRYDNIMVHCINDDAKPACIAGGACESIKIKSEDVGRVFGGLVSNDSDFRSLIGMAIEPFYDRYGRVLQATITDYEERG